MLRLKLLSRGFYHRAAQLSQKVSQCTDIQQKHAKNLRILFFVNRFNGLSQRVAQELREQNHVVEVHEISESAEMTSLLNASKPDLVLCPFLTKRVPEEVWTNPSTPCLIVHPGREGDRGASSLDWAIKEGKKIWGVTVMEAAEEMDSGDIWSTMDFDINRSNINTLRKSSLYDHEVTNAAVYNCLQSVKNMIEKNNPRPLDYSLPHVKGKLRRNMKKSDRIIDWELPMEEVARIVRMSDSSPGAVAKLRPKGTESNWTEEMRVFGAHLEEDALRNVKGVPGEIIGQRDEAVLVKCGQGAVWISHIKKKKLKLPATFWLSDYGPFQELPSPVVEIKYKEFPRTFQEIWTTVSPEGVCSVHFDFMNGAMSTSQCKRLHMVLKNLEQDDRIKVIVLKGGYDFFSNGIHLNVIESYANPSQESWSNINAVNDMIKCIFTSKKITVSALQGNAGAGGAMMALTSDIAVSRDGVVLTPRYSNMCLYGSEYHSFFLPFRVGKDTAQKVLSSNDPVLSTEAVRIGLLDDSSGGTVQEFGAFVEELTKELSRNLMVKEHQKNKRRYHTDEWFKYLEEHKREELKIMAENFVSDDYHRARKAFVYH